MQGHCWCLVVSDANREKKGAIISTYTILGGPYYDYSQWAPKPHSNYKAPILAASCWPMLVPRCCGPSAILIPCFRPMACQYPSASQACTQASLNPEPLNTKLNPKPQTLRYLRALQVMSRLADVGLGFREPRSNDAVTHLGVRFCCRCPLCGPC